MRKRSFYWALSLALSFLLGLFAVLSLAVSASEYSSSKKATLLFVPMEEVESIRENRTVHSVQPTAIDDCDEVILLYAPVTNTSVAVTPEVTSVPEPTLSPEATVTLTPSVTETSSTEAKPSPSPSGHSTEVSSVPSPSPSSVGIPTPSSPTQATRGNLPKTGEGLPLSAYLWLALAVLVAGIIFWSRYKRGKALFALVLLGLALTLFAKQGSLVQAEGSLRPEFGNHIVTLAYDEETGDLEVPQYEGWAYVGYFFYSQGCIDSTPTVTPSPTEVPEVWQVPGNPPVVELPIAEVPDPNRPDPGYIDII